MDRDSYDSRCRQGIPPLTFAAALRASREGRPPEGVRLAVPPYQPVGGGACRTAPGRSAPLPVQGLQMRSDLTTLGFLQQRSLGIRWPRVAGPISPAD
jgi:hypothetical protein